MSVWIRNLKSSLENRLVVILHGNVRDRYIDEDGRVYDNLTALLTEAVRGLLLSFSELVFYDPVSQGRRVNTSQTPAPEQKSADGDAELAATGSTRRSGQKAPPARTLAKWVRQLGDLDQNRFVTAFYLDKLIAYKTSYQDDKGKFCCGWRS